MPSRFEPQEKKCMAVHPDEKILPTTPLLTSATFQWHLLEKERRDKTVSPRGTSGRLGEHGRGKAPVPTASGFGRGVSLPSWL